MDNILEFTNIALIVFGLVLIATELVVGVDSMFDLVLSGLSLMFAGIIAGLMGNSWEFGLVLSIVFLLSYWIIGRSFIKERLDVDHTRTNADGLLGKKAKIIRKTQSGKYIIKIDGEEWTCDSEDELILGDNVVVVDNDGAILDVRKI